MKTLKVKKFLSVLLPLSLVLTMLFACAFSVAAEDKPANSVNLTVGDNIVSHYYIDTAYYRSHGCDYLQYTYNGTSNKEDYTSVTSPVVSLATAGDQYDISATQAAAQIAEPTVITIFKDGEVFDTVSYSAKTYCDKIISMNDETLVYFTGRPYKLTTLCKSIIAYGKAAQGLFSDYMSKEGAVAITDDYSDDLGLDSATYTPTITTNQGSNVRFSSATFICASSAGMRFYYTPSSASYGDPVVTGPSGISWQKGNGYIQINNIKPVFFEDKITVSYGDASITMSVLDYAGTVINSGSFAENMTNLAKSLIVHNDKADEYFVTHTLEKVSAVAATCTEAGNIEYYVCTDCGQYCSDAEGKTEITAADTVIPALGHSYTAVVTDPTCTEQGYTTYTCSRCGDSYKDDYTDALGHTPAAAVHENEVAATCTEDGSYDEVVYCSVCNTKLSTTAQTVPATGHTESSTWTVKTGATLTSDGTEVKTCTVCGAELSSRTVKNFTLKLPNTADYLYRIGNGNNVTLGTLFANESGANIASVTATVTKNTGNAAGKFTANASDWRSSTLKFSGTGVATITLKHGTNTVTTLKVEVVAGTNYTEGSNLGAMTSANAVLLGNVNVPATRTLNNGKILFGNGFTVTDTRSSTASAYGYINMSGGATINNAVLLGQVYSSAVTSGTNNEGYAPGIWITGDANIYNSYVSEAKYAAQIDGGEVNLVNSTFAGGAVANICIGGGDVTLENCTTSLSNRGGLKGLAIRATSSDCKINLKGTFKQYNWLTKDDLPATYSGILGSFYSDSEIAYTYGDKTYLNMGIFFVTEATSITKDQVEEAITDSTANVYVIKEKTALGTIGTVYTATAGMGAPDMVSTAPTYNPVTNGQYDIVPTVTWNYTKNDSSVDDKTYCTYNSTKKETNISFVEGSSFEWDTSILTVSKNGSNISPTVTMNGTDYTGKKITFNTEGDYEVVYTYTDPYNYNVSGTAYSHTYTKTVKISVHTVEAAVQIYHPDFTYADIGVTASKQVTATVSGTNRVYVMPDASATSSTIGSKTVDGKTIYFPIVTVSATNSTGGTYDSGKGYYFAPAFKNINITDYDQDNQTEKTAKYTYNSSATKWPHGIASGSKPDTEYYYYTATNTSTNTNRPYGRSMNEQYYGYKLVSSLGGLCFSSNEMEPSNKVNNANNQLVEFYYKGTDNITYYYYIQYNFQKFDYVSGGCLAEGTMITMADGSQKPVEAVKPGESVLTWSFWKGEFEVKPVLIKYDHGKDNYEVLNLTFSDGTTQKVISSHGFFDSTINNTVYLCAENVADYVGHRFIKQAADGSNTEIELVSYNVANEEIGSYSIVSMNNITVYANNMLTVSNEIIDNIYEYFDMGDGLKYDEAKMQADIEKYGLYTYDDFRDYISEDLYEAFNGKYYKVLVSKGLLTYEDILYMIEYYVNPYEKI